MRRESFLTVLLNNKKLRSFLKKCNKIHIIAIFFIIFWLSIIWKMFSYTVVNHDFYKELADKQQIWEVVVPVTRWTIFSSWERETVLWTSLNLYDVAIDPKMDWDKEQLLYFLQDLVYKQICYLKTKKECKNNLIKYLRVLDIDNFENSEVFIKKLLNEKLKEKLYQTKVNSVLIDKELSNEQITWVISLWIQWIYPTWSYIYANPEEISNPSLVADRLSSIIGMQKEDLAHLFRKRDLRYVPVINKLSIHISEFLKNYINDEKSAINKWILDVKKSINKFIILTPNPNRFYPENELAAQVIGFVDSEWVWHYWIEGQFNSILKWNNWKIVSRKDILWRIIDPISLEKDDLIWEWVSIITTIDRNIQKKVEETLKNWVIKYRANKWTIIVMDPKTWKILSMANYPTYDLNNFWDVYDLEKVKYSEYPNPETDLLWYPIFVQDKINWEKYYYDNKEIYLRTAEREELWDMSLVKYKYKNDYGAQVYKNDAISSLYEPGSVMKAMTVAAWIDTWEITTNSMYNDEWEVKIDTFTIKNIAKQCLWYHTFWNALSYSCNVWMIRIAQKVWKVLMYDYFESFWFWDITKIDLSGEVTWKIKPWERWSTAQLLTSSYWLWINITPIQIAAAYSVLANGWVYFKPNIIEEIRFPDWKIVKYKAEEERRVVKESTSKTVSTMLQDWCVNWVAKNWFVAWYDLACKSGTAQIAYKWKYEVWVWSTVWTFAWYGPLEDPKFVIIVKLDRIRTSQYWWETSWHIFAEVAKYLLDYYWVPKKEIKKEEEKK